MSQDALPPHERRSHPREPANWAGRAWYGPQAALWADCTLRDLSVGGARVEIPAVIELPRRVYFAHGRQPVIYAAIVKWRRGGAAGLSFQEEFPLDKCLAAPLDRMASDWRALYG